MNTNAPDYVNSEAFRRHISRLRSSLAAHGHDTTCEFITEHTYIRGRKFSFKDHEYQEKILRDNSQEKVVKKAAQMGLSEIFARLALAKSVLVNGFSTIYTLPAATAAQNFMKTRIDPVIDSSEYLRDAVSGDIDNSSMKQFGDSFLYLKGAQVDRQAISVPADLLINDEVDNSSQEVMTLYESRLNHSSYAEKIKLSTPSIPDFGIDLLFKESRQHFNLCKCNHCGHWFFPQYYENVVIPDFNRDLDRITKGDFRSHSFRWQEAYVACPECWKPVDLGPANREWVVKNPGDAYVAAGYQCSPFDCPAIIKPSALIKSSVEYKRPQDFRNQRLGESMEDKESSFDLEELNRALISEYPGGGFSYVMGLDMGLICWCTIAAVCGDGTLIIVKTEGIPMHKVKQRRAELAKQYRVRMTVVDSVPYAETVLSMQQDDNNLFAAVYVETKGIELFRVKDQEEDDEKAQEQIKQVNVVRNRGFDQVMLELRSGRILKVMDENDDLWKEHLRDQKRVKEFRNEELIMVWKKSKGDDHLHHSLLYTLVASRMLGVSAGVLEGVPIILGKFGV
ncbi:phage terminase large subunit family protein [Ferribacterium limneticum]|uniref:phage terminase large subunit family protein n=1 Tax=Ferribacterium limneticum TaxID=76259 RepID=UPI001CF7ED5B|nr:phage terminase large subunit family protein [Ferribacterium limneticum]UCV26782.1 phage terminase large subunit family protein [Ferribacterium limneticum]UCV30699.1 phage terminase large subunit family protein [Ferribacterium limneticum]